MSFHQPRRLRTYLVGHAAIAALFLTGLSLLLVRSGRMGDDIAARREIIEAEQPELVLVGNSILDAAVDDRQLSQLSGMKSIVAHSNGSASLWWYLYVKNVATRSRHKAPYLGIMFRDTFLTEPTFRVSGTYQERILRVMTHDEPLVDQLSYPGAVVACANSPLTRGPRQARNWLNRRIYNRVEDLLQLPRKRAQLTPQRVFAKEKMVPELYNAFQLGYEEIKDTDAHDFDARLERSYLPHILDMLEEARITPIFIRAKRRRDLDPSAEPPQLPQYIVKLRHYVTARGALWFDFTHEDRIQLSHFADGDHLDRVAGRKLFTQLLAEQLVPTLAGRDATILRR